MCNKFFLWESPWRKEILSAFVAFEHSWGMAFSCWRSIYCLNSIPTSSGRRRMTDGIDASFRLDSAYGTQLSTTLIHLTPCIFLPPCRRKSDMLIQQLQKNQDKSGQRHWDTRRKNAALWQSLDPWRVSFPAALL